MNRERMRKGVRSAFDVCMDRFTSGYSHTAIVLPTRYGKSDLARLLAHEAQRLKIVSGAIAFSPYDSLSRQLVGMRKIQEMAMRYSLDFPQAMRIRQMKSFAELAPFSNGEYLLSANMQLAYEENFGVFQELVVFERRRTGLPILLIVDECQFVSEAKKWGEFLQKAAEIECLLMLMTATPIREDGDSIPGFEAEILDEEDERRWLSYDAGDGLNNRIDVWMGSRRLVRLKAHHETTFKEAWNEDPSPLCHLNREVIDTEVLKNGEDQGVRLSQLSDTEARKLLGKATRDPVFVEQGVRKMLELLSTSQSINAGCAAIVFTGNDQSWSERDNEQAEAVKEMIEDLGESYLGRDPEVSIVTMKSDSKTKPSKRLETFVGNEIRDGHGDVLIVKQIGGAGLDCPRLKTLLDISPVRTVASVIQRLTRVATPFEGIEIANVIGPRDPRYECLWRRFIVEEGGELDRSDLWIPDIKIGSYLKPKPDSKPEDDLLLGGSELAAYDDSKGNIGQMERYAQIQALLKEFPELAAKKTKAMLSEAVGRLTFIRGYEDQHPAGYRCIGKDLEDSYSRLNETANEIVMSMLNGQYRREDYESKQISLWTGVYREAGIPRGTKLRAIVELTTLAKLQSIMERMKGSLCPGDRLNKR
jgi:hypothetical protein